MNELRMFKNGAIDWVIAESPEDASRIDADQHGYTFEEHVDEFGPPEDEWEELGADTELSRIDDDGNCETKTVRQWIDECGRGFSASTEY